MGNPPPNKPDSAPSRQLEGIPIHLVCRQLDAFPPFFARDKCCLLVLSGCGYSQFKIMTLPMDEMLHFEAMVESTVGLCPW